MKGSVIGLALIFGGIAWAALNQPAKSPHLDR